MIDAAGFRMVELITREDLVDHPVWADFGGDEDRDRILTWGVSAGALDDAIAHYDYCGRPPLYPVLDPTSAAQIAHLTLALRVTLPGGAVELGYQVGGLVLGVYRDGEEYCLNPTLPKRLRAERDRLAAAVGCEASALAALPYESVAEWTPAGRLSGVFRFEFDD